MSVLFSQNDAGSSHRVCRGPYLKTTDSRVRHVLDARLTLRAVCEFSYAQSKAAERHLTQLMSAALQPFNIRVNCVCPGLFPSGLTINQEGKLHAPMQEATKVIPKG